MKLINEAFDEKNQEYIYTLSGNEEEWTLLEKKTKEFGFASIEEYIISCLKWTVSNKPDFQKWIKENRTDKCDIGTIGKPLFHYGDKVGFYLTPYKEKQEKFFIGTIDIIDSYGTFEQHKEPSYDILVQDFNGTGEPCLVKHVRESECYRLYQEK